MNKLVFIEDIFLKFVDTIEENIQILQKSDRSAVISFYNTLIVGNKITANQASYILRILEKYKQPSIVLGFDFSNEIIDPVWKNDFRVIDMSRKVWVEEDNDGVSWICLKFPYQLKPFFEKEIPLLDMFDSSDIGNRWDKDRKIRLLSLYDHNIVQIQEFCINHNFSFEESFYDAVAAIEEIWSSSDSVEKKSIILNEEVVLINATSETNHWFQSNKNGNIDNDALLAKSMGYVLDTQPLNKIQKIASTKTNTFYTAKYTDMFEITEKINGKVAILLDRSANALEWLKTLSMYIDSYNLNRNDFKVCFRESNKEKPEFNNWIKENGFGGKVNEGKYLIFQHKPAKWLFSLSEDVKIIVTNNVYPSTNSLTKQWIKTHPCVIYVEDIKPSGRGKEFVEL